MAEVDDFLAAIMPHLEAAEIALHNGDASLRSTTWSHRDPVTLFGAVKTVSGWGELAPTFEFLASRFSNCQSYEHEVLSAGASGDLAYIVGYENTTASVAGSDPTPYSLRVTTLFRREDGEWKIIHRHADPRPDSDSARELATRMNNA